MNRNFSVWLDITDDDGPLVKDKKTKDKIFLNKLVGMS